MGDVPWEAMVLPVSSKVGYPAPALVSQARPWFPRRVFSQPEEYQGKLLSPPWFPAQNLGNQAQIFL